VDPQTPRRRKSLARFKQIRNRQNRRARKEILDIINRLLDQVTESLANLPPVFPSPFSLHISSPISEKRFPSPSRYDLISYPISSPLLPSPIYDSSFHHAYSPTFLPYLPRLLPHLLGEIPAPSSPLQFHDFEELPFISIATHFPQSTSHPPPGAYIVGPDIVDLKDLRRVISTADPNHGILVYFPGIPLPYLVPTNFFYRFFPLSYLP